MPLYEYACRACGHQFEVQQRFSEDPLKVCPQCGSEVRRLIFPVGVVFKGNGFYKTDNRKDTDKEQVSTGSGSSPGESPAASASKGETKAEPAAASPSSPPAGRSGSRASD